MRLRSLCKPQGKPRPKQGHAWVRRAGIAGLVAYVFALGWEGYWNSPNLDEVAHLPAGIYIWHSGRFDLYRVNPPLVKLIASLPVVLLGPRTDWRLLNNGGPANRPEWSVGSAFVSANPGNWEMYFVIARWTVIPLSLLGAYIVWRWARELYGESSGLVALFLWCLCPNVTAWASTITPDIGATALGASAGYCYWRWLRRPSWGRTLMAGLLLGLSELTKFTWIVLFLLWPLLWCMWRITRRQFEAEASDCPYENSAPAVRCQRHMSPTFFQLTVILGLALYVINAAYGFEGSFTPLRSYAFVSKTLSGRELAFAGAADNRFAGKPIGIVPVPLPTSYLSGIDLQKYDFEQGKWSYLRGEWKHGGWWYYYLYAAMIKVPLGTWLLGVMALGLTTGLWSGKGVRKYHNEACDHTNAQSPGRQALWWRDEIVLLLPAIVVFLLVSSQTGFSRYFRYVLPCCPFIFIWISKVGQLMGPQKGIMSFLAMAALVWMGIGAMRSYPHSISYFNELAGGTAGGPRHLLDANIDWGQDMWYLKRWYDDHPEARPFYVACYSFISPAQVGIDAPPPPVWPPSEIHHSSTPPDLRSVGPVPGWHAVSVNLVYDQKGINGFGAYGYFSKYSRPTAIAGSSIYIYHISPAEANRVRKLLNLPPLPPGEASSS